MSSWLLALAAIVVSIVVGSLLSRITRNGLQRAGTPTAVRENAGAIGSLLFSIVVVVGLVVALGITRPESLDQISGDAVAYLPRALSAGIVVIVGNMLATVASSAAAQAIGRSEASAARSVPSVIRIAIIGFTGILAAAQLGIDTTTINIAVAALLGSIALGLGLLIGFGGRSVSAEIAAGRVLRRMLEPGDELTSDVIAGMVITVHSTAVEISANDESVLIPNTDLLGSRMSIKRTSHSVASDS